MIRYPQLLYHLRAGKRLALEQIGAVAVNESFAEAADILLRYLSHSPFIGGDPELSLSQLAELCDPPVSKSCMNHRMRKLNEEAKKIL